MKFSAESTASEVLGPLDLTGQSFLITGVSAGLGVETARALVSNGASVVGTARDLVKAEQALLPVRALLQGSATLDVREIDLASLSSIRRGTDALIASGRRFNGIIANAGVMACPKGYTEDGFELQFGTNHLGHFLLVNRLVPLVLSPGRIVIVSSSSHHRADVSFEDANWESIPYDPWLAYSRSKTANVLHAVALDSRLRTRGVRAVALHPGAVPTSLSRHISPTELEQRRLAAAPSGANPVVFKSLEQGAATSVWAACVANAEDIGGRYLEDCKVAGPKLPTAQGGVADFALDPDTADELWQLSEGMVGEAFTFV